MAQFKTLPPREIPSEKEIKPVSNTYITTYAADPGVGFCTELATGHNYPDRNFSAVKPLPKINPDGTLSKVAVTRQKLAGETNKMWDPGQTLYVYIDPNNSTQEFRDSIMKYAREWEKYANIKFQEVFRMQEAQIKIGFKNDGNWSDIGKDALKRGIYEETMNYEKSIYLNWTELRALVLHEFGHALGFIHEHQSPNAGINWDREKVYAYYAKAPYFWKKDQVDINIFNRYSTISTNYSAYDSLSIMHYRIPASLTLDGKGTRKNFVLSDMDKYYARLLYPFPPTPGNAFGILRTGDDCDEIVFNVEYNVIKKDEIEFVLMLGSDRGKDVTWWKQIGIPLTWNRENKLWVQNHSLIPQENRRYATVRLLASEIDRSKGITFWKAKLFGVQTLLGYQWKVWEALPGGTRVTLSWNKDSCN